MKNIKYDFDFNSVQFIDIISKETLSIMNDEVLHDCFNENGDFLSYNLNSAILTSILKHCSNFPTKEFSDEEMFQICEYSNLYEYILANMANISFIYKELKDSALFVKEKRIHSSKLDELINVLINSLKSIDLKEFIAEEDIEKLKNIISSKDDSAVKLFSKDSD